MSGWSIVRLRLPYLAVSSMFALIRLLPMSDIDKDIEILTLRHQLAWPESSRAASSLWPYGGLLQFRGLGLVLHRSHVNETVRRIQDIIESRMTERLSLAELAHLTRLQPTHGDPALRPGHRDDPIAVPAGAAPGTSRAPDRTGHDGGIRRPLGRLPRRPHAAATTSRLTCIWPWRRPSA